MNFSFPIKNLSVTGLKDQTHNQIFSLTGIQVLLDWQSCLFEGYRLEEQGGSVVECLTWAWGVAGLSLIRGTALCPWARHFILCWVLVKPRKTRPPHDWKIVDWDVKNQGMKGNIIVILVIFSWQTHLTVL